MVELQPSKLIMRVRFPPPALGCSRVSNALSSDTTLRVVRERSLFRGATPSCLRGGDYAGRTPAFRRRPRVPSRGARDRSIERHRQIPCPGASRSELRTCRRSTPVPQRASSPSCASASCRWLALPLRPRRLHAPRSELARTQHETVTPRRQDSPRGRSLLAGNA
jgi:hypothetical protein